MRIYLCSCVHQIKYKLTRTLFPVPSTLCMFYSHISDGTSNGSPFEELQARLDYFYAVEYSYIKLIP